MKTHEKLRQLREEKEWSQEDMAERMDMSPSGYAKIERGDTQLKLEKLERIAQIFQIDIVELMSNPEKGVVFLLNENSNNGDYHTVMAEGSHYYCSNEAVTIELEKLKMSLKHKDELLEQQEKMLADKEREINMLNEFIQTLKSK